MTAQPRGVRPYVARHGQDVAMTTLAVAPGMMPAGTLQRYKDGQVVLALRLLRFRAQMDTVFDTRMARAGRDLATAVRGSRVLLAHPGASATERQTGLS